MPYADLPTAAAKQADPCADLDRKTYSAVREALASGAPVARDFVTGAIVPAHLRGVGYGACDLHASSFAEIDASVAHLLKGRRS